MQIHLVMNLGKKVLELETSVLRDSRLKIHLQEFRLRDLRVLCMQTTYSKQALAR